MKLNTLEHCTPLVRPLVKKIPDITRAETIPKTYKVGGGANGSRMYPSTKGKQRTGGLLQDIFPTNLLGVNISWHVRNFSLPYKLLQFLLPLFPLDVIPNFLQMSRFTNNYSLFFHRNWEVRVPLASSSISPASG